MVNFTKSKRKAQAKKSPVNRRAKKRTSKKTTTSAKPQELRRWSKLERKVKKWWWDQRIPQGSLSLVCGDPDEGKGMFLMKMVADFTNGKRMPDGVPANAELIHSGRDNVLWLSSEDTTEYTLMERLELFGGDTDKMFDVDPETVKGGFLNLVKNLDVLESWFIDYPEISLVVFDPLESFVGSIDGNKSTDVRRALDPLLDVLAKHDVTGIGICHLNKTSLAVTAKHKVKGSVAWIAGPRSAWLIAPDPEGDGDEQKVFVKIKNNLADKPRPGISFLLGPKYKGIKIDGTVKTTANQAVSTAPKISKREECQTAIINFMQGKGWMLAKDIEENVSDFGERTFKEARRSVATYRKDGYQAPSEWKLKPEYEKRPVRKKRLRKPK